MTLKIKMQKSKNKKYQVVYSIVKGKETYIGTEKALLKMKRQQEEE